MRKKDTMVPNQVLRIMLKDAAMSPNGVTWTLPSHGAAMSVRQRLYVERDRWRKDQIAGPFATLEQATEWTAIELLRIILKPLPDGQEELTMTRESIELQNLASKDSVTGMPRMTVGELLQEDLRKGWNPEMEKKPETGNSAPATFDDLFGADEARAADAARPLESK